MPGSGVILVCIKAALGGLCFVLSYKDHKMLGGTSGGGIGKELWVWNGKCI